MGSQLLKRVSGYPASVPGLPVVVAIVLVVLNFVLVLLPDLPAVDWLEQSNFFLDAALVPGFVRVLLRDAL